MEQIKKQPNILYGVVLFRCLLPFVTPVTALFPGLFFPVIGWKNEWVVQYAPFTLKAGDCFHGFWDESRSGDQYIKKRICRCGGLGTGRDDFWCFIRYLSII
ncbi:MAG: hypothetical protein AB2L20_27610 [Mangrovibacterium sp.]